PRGAERAELRRGAARVRPGAHAGQRLRRGVLGRAAGRRGRGHGPPRPAARIPGPQHRLLRQRLRRGRVAPRPAALHRRPGRAAVPRALPAVGAGPGGHRPGGRLPLRAGGGGTAVTAPEEEDLFVRAQPEGFAGLLAGAVDVHVHGRPDLAVAFANRGDDLAVIRLAQRCGITGWVLKSPLWPTADRAHLLQRLVGEGFTVHGSVTLNPVLGGVSPTVVELAAAHGARVIFLPTWGAAADVDRGGYIATLLTRLAPSFPGFAEQRAVRLLD